MFAFPITTHEIGQMDMTFRVEQNIVRFHISMDNALRVYVPQSATELRQPEPDCLFCESFSRYMKPEVASCHQVLDYVSVEQASS
jgi:hypothetical protein